MLEFLCSNHIGSFFRGAIVEGDGLDIQSGSTYSTTSGAAGVPRCGVLGRDAGNI